MNLTDSASQCGSHPYKPLPVKEWCMSESWFAMTHHFLSCVVMYGCCPLVSSGQIPKEQQ